MKQLHIKTPTAYSSYPFPAQKCHQLYKYIMPTNTGKAFEHAMQIIIADTYEAMSGHAAEDLLALLQSVSDPLICTASGASPVGLYKQLISRVKSLHIDASSWSFVGLDEWKGMNGIDEGSCRYHLNNDLFNPLDVNAGNICFFDGRAEDLKLECQRVEDFITQQNGIDVAILGIGVNGHIGMNEPGTPSALRSHIADIHPVTQQIGQKYFKQPQRLDTGLSLGLATLLEAKHILLIASGVSKAEIIYRTIHEEISEQIPATLLRQHPSVHIYLDRDAARLLAS